MKVLARVASAQALAPDERTASMLPTTEFDVTVGDVYTVAGMGAFEGELQMLVVGDWGRPDWFPAVLFDVVESDVPGHWVAMLSRRAEDGWSFRLGYPDLAHSEDHVSGLIERDPAELETFYREAGETTPPQT